MSSFSSRINAFLAGIVDRLYSFVLPPTTPAQATVVDKFFDHIPDPNTRNLGDNIGIDSRHAMIEVPALKVAIAGTDGTPSIYVPTAVYNQVEVGGHVEVRVRPSRFFANITRVSYAH